MRIIEWNCQGAFRLKKFINDIDTLKKIDKLTTLLNQKDGQN